MEEITRDLLEKFPMYFYMVRGGQNHKDGFKLSIQGNTLDDSMYLVEHVVPFLVKAGITFKLATKRLIDYKHDQQSHKLLTIYSPNHIPITEMAEMVYKLMDDYKGGDNVKQPESYTHFKNAIYYRNDRDENGNYITAN